MKLYIKQKVFSFGDKFTVKDEEGSDRYSVWGEPFSFTHTLHVQDAEGGEAALLQSRIFSLTSRCVITVGGSEAAQVVREFTLFRPSYRIEGPGWELSGDFMSHEYSLSDGGRTLMTLSKEWFTWGDSYVLDIAEGVNDLLCLCIVLAVDSANERSSHN